VQQIESKGHLRVNNHFVDVAGDIAELHRATAALRANIGQVIVGKGRVIDLLLIALLCDGHVLLEDAPGTGKTMLAKTLARSLDCVFQRIQFTPDLLPSDVTGVSVFNQKTGDFEFRPGPLATQILLADEINRAGPRTQSALLEAMEERQVTVDGVTHTLPRPFLVLATQNPIDLEGTFPLPEAQVDRFLMRVAVGYPSEEEERAILRRFRTHNPLAELPAVVDAAQLLRLQALVRQVFVHPTVEQYIVRLVRGTREHPSAQLGVGRHPWTRVCAARRCAGSAAAGAQPPPRDDQPRPRARQRRRRHPRRRGGADAGPGGGELVGRR
jgi:MoxR-like ATPase